MSVQGRRKYDPEFKRNAVRLNEEAGRTIPELAENLGVGSLMITADLRSEPGLEKSEQKQIGAPWEMMHSKEVCYHNRF